MATAMCGNCYQSLDMETCDVCPNCGRRFRGGGESAETRHLRREFESEVELLNDRVEHLEKWAEEQQYDERIKRLETRTKSEMTLNQQKVGAMHSRLVGLEKWATKQKHTTDELVIRIMGQPDDNSDQTTDQPADKQTVINKATNLIETLRYQISAIHDGEDTALQELRKLLNRVEK